MNPSQTYPVVLEDQILYWMQNSHDGDIRCLVVFQDRIDLRRMARAVRLSLDAEPVLGCRYVTGLWRSHWERVKNLDSAPLCTLVETRKYDHDLGLFMAETPNTNLLHGPQIRTWILRSQTDTLLIKINHIAGDGGGLKDYTRLLAKIYTRLESDPGYIPKVNTGRRSLSQVTDHFDIKHKVGILRRSLRDAGAVLFPPRYVFTPMPQCSRSVRSMICTRISREQFAPVHQYAKKMGATLNDVLVAAHLRAFFGAVNTEGDPRLVITADLRRYIPGGQAEAVCNLSGFFYLNMGADLGRDFGETLSKVQTNIDFMKQDYLALGNFPLTAAAFKFLPFPAALKLHDVLGNTQKKQTRTRGRVAPLFTNTGNFDPQTIAFGKVPVRWACITTTIAYPPVLSLCLSGSNGGMTLTSGFCTSFVARSQVKEFLDRFVLELDSLAAQ